MNTRPSLRHGLPYGWWKSGDFWGAFAAFVTGVITIVGISLVILAWWLDWKPTW